LKRFAFALLLFCHLSGISQPRTILEAISRTTCAKESGEKLIEKIIKHTESLRLKRSSKLSDGKFLRKVFYETHRKFLKEYYPYSSLDQLVTDGKYDCLTATALYASIFEILGIGFKIIETNYHIFILANIEGKDVLIETTDSVSGIVTDTKKILKRANDYRDSEPVINKTNSKGFYFPFHLLNEVSGKELSGLLYFNQAVKEFNSHNWISCQALLRKSRAIYNSPRIEQILELTNLIITPEKAGDKRLSNIEVALRPLTSLEE
jgi:hypothetical protein